ncbi:hypothetical protein N2W54_001780 [Lotmaria passim]
MSTLTVCPYCGEAMRFDCMKRHLLSCEGCSPFRKSQSRSQSSRSPSPQKTKPVSGLEFYNQLNKLSLLTRSKSSGGHGPQPHFAVSADQQDTAIVRELMYPSTTLTIDVAPSHSPTPPSSSSSSMPLRAVEVGEEAQRRPSASWAAPGAMDTISPLASPPPPAVHVNLTHPDTARNDVARSRSASGRAKEEEQQMQRERGERARRSVSLSSSSTAYRSASAASKPPEAEARNEQRRQKQQQETERKAAPAASSSSLPRSCSKVSKRAKSASAPVESTPQATAAPNPARISMESAAVDRTAVSQPVRDGAASAKLPGLCGVAGAADDDTHMQSGERRQDAALVDSAATSSHRPVPQLSSFAIRLRSSGGSTVHNGTGIAAAPGNRPTSDELAVSVSLLSESVRQVERLVQKQQEQYNALLHAHTDLSRQVAAQQGAHNGLMRRSIEQAAAVDIALQQHTCQWRNEQATLNESVATLWANVSEMRHMLSPPPALQQQQQQHQHQQHITAPPGLSSLPQTPPQTYPALHAPAVASAETAARMMMAGPEDKNSVSVASSSNAHQQQLASHQEHGAHQPPSVISVQRAAPAEDSAYYSDIASFIHHDAPVFSASASAVMGHSGGLHASAVTSVQDTSRSVFAHIPTTAVIPPSLTKTAASLKTTLSRESSMSHVGRRSTTLPRSYVMDVQQQRNSRTLVEDRVLAMLHAKPTVVVQRSPWR